MDTTITSANSVVLLACSLFPQGYKLTGYSADRAWETTGVDLTESQMGVDGRKTSGYVFNETEQTFTMQADSPARLEFWNPIIAAMKAARETMYLTGTFLLPSTGETFVGVRGTLKNAKTIPDAAKVLGPVDYVISWQTIDAALS